MLDLFIVSIALKRIVCNVIDYRSIVDGAKIFKGWAYFFDEGLREL